MWIKLAFNGVHCWVMLWIARYRSWSLLVVSFGHMAEGVSKALTFVITPALLQ